MNRLLAALVLVPFTAFTGWIVFQHGVDGFARQAVGDVGSIQVLLDLCIAMVIALGWLIRDAAKKGLRAWPWVLAAVPLGSISPLAYLVYTGWLARSERS